VYFVVPSVCFSEERELMADEIDIAILKYTQDGLPLTPTPFADVAEALALTEEDVLSRLKRMLDAGEVRRVGASIAHHKVGITANAMCAWRVPPERVEEVGQRMAECPEVTHCYERPTAPDWPYSLYTMIHGYRPEECEQIIERLSRETGVTDYVIMYSDKEYKKEWSRL